MVFKSFHIQAVLLLLLAGLSARASPPVCFQPGQRCMEASDQLIIRKNPCCGLSTCSVQKPGESGLFCSEEELQSGYIRASRICFPSGARCGGGPGIPVDLRSRCCNPADECVRVHTWGRRCMRRHDVSRRHRRHLNGHNLRSHNSRQRRWDVLGFRVNGGCAGRHKRCAGAPGMPRRLQKPCCVQGDKCVEKPELGWGLWCADATATAAPSTTDAVTSVQNAQTTNSPDATEPAPLTSTLPRSDTTETTTSSPTSTAAQTSPTGVPISTTTTLTTGSDTSATTATETMTTSEPTTATPTITLTTDNTSATSSTASTSRPATGPPSTNAPATMSTSSTTTLPPTASSTTGSSSTTAITASTTEASSRTQRSGQDVCEGHISVRPDITELTDAQWNDYVEAVKLLREKPGDNGVSVLENFAQIHARNGLHFGAYFAPWHRAMLWEFEKELDSVKPGVRIPTYDWSEVSTRALETEIFGPSRLGGSVGMEGGNQAPIPNGPFVGQSSRASGTLTLVTRDFNKNIVLQDRASIDVAISTLTTFSNFAVFLEGAHNSFHVQMGGSMNNLLYSPDEPAFYVHHAFVDKVWREWQQYGNGNKFGGTHPSVGGAAVDLDEIMQPFNRTVRQILEGISGCVTYANASTRSAVALPGSGRQYQSLRRSNVSGSSDGTAQKIVPNRMEFAAERSAYVDSTEPPKEPKLKSVRQKRELQRRIAAEKIGNPSQYKEKVLMGSKALADSVSSSAILGAPEQLQELMKKTYAFVNLEKGIDLTDVKEVTNEVPQDIAKDGKAEAEAIDSNNEDALPLHKRDVKGTSSDVSVGVEGY